MKRCGRCHEWKPSAGFSRRKRSADGLQAFCRQCKHSTYTAYYRDNRETFRATLQGRTARQRDVNRRFIAAVLSEHPCVDCGLADPIVFEFDHVRGQKIGHVGAMAYAPVALPKLKREVEKCDVRCANCHRKRTAKNWRFTLRTRIEQEKDDIPSIIAGLLNGDCSSVG